MWQLLHYSRQIIVVCEQRHNLQDVKDTWMGSYFQYATGQSILYPECMCALEAGHCHHMTNFCWCSITAFMERYDNLNNSHQNEYEVH